MKILAASDLHLNTDCQTAIMRLAPQADIVVIAGDFAQRREGLRDFMKGFDGIADKAVLVPGNNETEVELREATSATVLHGTSVTLKDVVFGGIGCAIPPLPPLPWGSFDMAESDAADVLDTMPALDVLISHSPPHAHCDFHVGVDRHLGSQSIAGFVEKQQPRLVICGHVHHAWGQRSMIGDTLVANVGPVPVFFEV